MTTLLPRPAPSRRRLDLPRVRISVPDRETRDQLILALILFIGLAFRVHGFEWDDATHQHPDERFMTIVASDTAMPTSIGNYFDTQRSTLNPYQRGHNNYAYGQ